MHKIYYSVSVEDATLYLGVQDDYLLQTNK